jgi:hypothetical protein
MASFSGSVQFGTHDGFWELTGGTPTNFTNNVSTVNVLRGGPLENGFFLLFSGVTIPQGYVINSGSIYLNAGSTSVDSRLEIKIANTSSATVPTSYANISSMPRISGIFWNSSATLGAAHTPLITTHLQSIFNRSDWQSGNNILFYIEASGTSASCSSKSFYAYEIADTRKPTLYIDYTPVVTTPISGNCTLFTMNGCYQSVWPSGDSTLTPNSGYVRNSLGGTGLYGYVDDSVWSSDIDYIRVRTSGVNSIPYIVYSDFNSSTGLYKLQQYITSSNYLNTLLTYPSTSGIELVNINEIEENVLFSVDAITNNYIKKYDLNSNVTTDILDLGAITIFGMCIDYRNQKLYFHSYTDLYKSDLNGSNIELVLSLSLPNHMIECTYDQKLARVYFTIYDTPKTKVYYIDNNLNIVPASYVSLNDEPESFEINTVCGRISTVDSATKNGRLYNFDNSTGIISVNDSTFIAASGTTKSIIDNATNSLVYSDDGLVFKRKNLSTRLVSTVGPSGYGIVDFDFPRGLTKQVIDFELQDFSTNIGLSDFGMFSDVKVLAKGQNALDVSYIKPEILARNNQKIWYGDYGNYGVYVSGGVTTDTIGELTSIINRTYNTRVDWNESRLRLNVYTATSSGVISLFDIYSTQVDANCSGVATAGSPSSGTCDFTMFVLPSGVDNNVSLYQLGTISSSGSIDLFLPSVLPTTSGLALYINSNNYIINSYMNLNVYAGTIYQASGNMDFFMWSTTNSGLYNTSPLFTKVDELTGTPTSNMNLSLLGSSSDYSTSNMNLYLRSDTPNLNTSTTFFLANSVSGINSGVYMYMCGPVGSSGWFPFSGGSINSMSLFLGRDAESIAWGLPFTVNGPIQASSVLTPFYVYGGYSGVNDNCTLVMPSSAMPVNNSLTLYTNGF